MRSANAPLGADCPTKYKALIVLEFILAECTNALIRGGAKWSCGIGSCTEKAKELHLNEHDVFRVIRTWLSEESEFQCPPQKCNLVISEQINFPPQGEEVSNFQKTGKALIGILPSSEKKSRALFNIQHIYSYIYLEDKSSDAWGGNWLWECVDVERSLINTMLVSTALAPPHITPAIIVDLGGSLLLAYT